MAEPIDPEILSWLEAEAKRMRNGEVRLEEPVPRSSELMSFVEQAFAQSLRRRFGVEIMSFTQSDKDEVLIAAREGGLKGPQKKLVDLYVDICNVWPDVLSQSYGGGTADFFEFRTDTVPELLTVLQQLSENTGELSDKLNRANRAYAEALQATRARKPEA